MAIDYRAVLDLHQLEIRNFLAHLLASDPGSPVEGQIYYNTTTHTLEFYNGTTFIVLGTLDQNSKAAANVDVNNHKLINVTDPTNPQDAATRAYILGLTVNSLTAPAADFSMNTHKITSVTDPTGAQDAATKAYVDAQIAGARDVKDSVRVATAAALPAYTRVGSVLTANANGALAAVDGVTLAAGESLLVKNGAAGADNGIYTVTVVGTGGTPFVLTRRTDADASAEVTSGLFVWVTEGTANADTGWLLTTVDPIVLNTTSLAFTQVSALGQVTAGAGLTKTAATLDVIAGAALATGGPGGGLVVAADSVAVDHGVIPALFAVDVGDGASTSITVTHNLATRDVIVKVYDKTTPFSEQNCEIRRTTTNTVTLVFSVAPTAAQYRCVVHG